RVQAQVMALLDAEQARTAGTPLLALIDGWLARVTATLAAIDPADLDARYIDGLIVDVAGARA
ncbi:MAG TPA: hypothetical protein VHE35_17960, partial [Kofleriaceae bacterium]|nr:hypothetical protein [Kofleriaceae bacterium]